MSVAKLYVYALEILSLVAAHIVLQINPWPLHYDTKWDLFV